MVKDRDARILPGGALSLYMLGWCAGVVCWSVCWGGVLECMLGWCAGVVVAPWGEH